MTYGSEEEFLAGVMPFITEGLERSECLLAVTTTAQIGFLRDSLGDRSEHVEFADSPEWYRSPNAALNRYRAFVTERFEAGAAWIRIVGEPVLVGRSDAELAAWTRYESFLNLAFASAPATIVCPYDMRALPEDLVADARRTHPAVAHGSDVAASPTYRGPELFLLDPPVVSA